MGLICVLFNWIVWDCTEKKEENFDDFPPSLIRQKNIFNFICLQYCFAWYRVWFHPFFRSFYNKRSKSSLSASLINESESEYSSLWNLWQHGGRFVYVSSSLQCSNSSLWCSSCINDEKSVSHPLHLCDEKVKQKKTNEFCNHKN